MLPPFFFDIQFAKFSATIIRSNRAPVSVFQRRENNGRKENNRKLRSTS
jgi:hypothetical protein